MRGGSCKNLMRGDSCELVDLPADKVLIQWALFRAKLDEFVPKKRELQVGDRPSARQRGGGQILACDLLWAAAVDAEICITSVPTGSN